MLVTVKLHRMFAFLLCFNGTICLYLSQYLNFLLAITFIALIGLVYFEKINLKISPKSWKNFTLILFLLLILFFFLSIFTRFKFFDPVDLIIYFLLYLKMNRLLTLYSLREFYQLYILSFLELLVSAILTNDVIFGLYFITFFIFAIFTLILHYIIADLKLARSSYSSEKPEISGKFFKNLSFFIILIFLFDLLAFLFFPRINFGYFFSGDKRKKIAISGLSDNISLGDVTDVITDDSIVLRVELEKERFTQEEMENFYFRGLTFDFYDGKKWKNSVKTNNLKVISGDERVTLNGNCDKKAIKQDIFIEPIDSTIIFGLDVMQCFEFKEVILRRLYYKNFSLLKDELGTYYFQKNISENRNYIIYSDRTENLKEKEFSSEMEKRYLQLPVLSERLKVLLHRIIKGKEGIHAARALEVHLKKDYSYETSLNLSDNPIEEFLLVTKKGYCTYFATAMAILLRESGIPSRIVSGFRGGVWNEYGNYLAVMQKNAHTWVEAYFKDIGWQRFDPTPSSEGFSSDFYEMNIFRKYLDYIKLRWDKYIIYYDLADQKDYFSRFKKSSSFLGKGMIGFFREVKTFFSKNPFEGREVVSFEYSPLIYLFFAGAIILSGLILLFVKLSSLKKRSYQYSHRLLEKLILKFIGFHKIKRKKNETPVEIFTYLPLSLQQRELADKILEKYNFLRFGSDEVLQEGVLELKSLLREYYRKDRPKV